jgi:hypothetical protein
VRIALISLITPADDDPRTPLGALQLAGRSLAARQLDLAIRLGCERVICVAAALDRPAIALQHQAEAAGVKFNLIAGPRPLLGLVSADAELVGFADGLLPSPDDAERALAGGNGVVVLPVEAGVAAGFERIDLNHAWAGMFAMPGRLVERLSELPSDCDTVSALLRIALQGRVPEKILPETLLTEGRWTLIETKEQLAELEPDWFRRQAAAPSYFAPGRALARLAVRMWGAGLLRKDIKPSALTALGGLLSLVGVGGAWLGHLLAGIALCGLGWVLHETGEALRPMARAGADSEDHAALSALARGGGLDLAFALVLALPMTADWPTRLFVALMVIGLLRLAGGQFTQKWAEFLQDRALLAAVLGGALVLGVLDPLLKVGGVLLLGALLGLAGRETRLTQT